MMSRSRYGDSRGFSARPQLEAKSDAAAAAAAAAAGQFENPLRNGGVADPTSEEQAAAPAHTVTPSSSSTTASVQGGGVRAFERESPALSPSAQRIRDMASAAILDSKARHTSYQDV
jgi:hypothetical protein